MKKVLLFLAVFLLSMGAVCAKKKVKVKGLHTRYAYSLIFAYSQANSVFEDDNIKLEIYDQSLWATNKTQKTIFIDLSQCFQVHNGSSHPMFSNKQDEKKASKKGVATSIDEFITIAPATGAKQNATWICDMSVGIYHKYGTVEEINQEFSDYDKRLLGIINDLLMESQNADPEKKHYIGAASRHLTEDESVNNIGASIAYAFNKRSENWNSVSLSTWVSDIIFAPYYVELPKDLAKNEKKGFGIKETQPAKIHVRANSPFEFNLDKSPITICQWEGNNKKGTFRLFKILIDERGLNVSHFLDTYDYKTYKKIICFDGVNADWGVMTPINGFSTITSQSFK